MRTKIVTTHQPQQLSCALSLSLVLSLSPFLPDEFYPERIHQLSQLAPD